MRLYTLNKEEEKDGKFIDVSLMSFMKCYILAALSIMGIVYGTAIAAFLLIGLWM